METGEFLGLRTAIYKVGDIKKAKAWYTEILGKKPYFDKPFYVGFDIGGYELGLQPVEEQEGGIIMQTTVAYWGVHDISSAYRRLLELGATAHEQPENVGGEVMTATVQDPWGNAFGIIYNPEFKV